MSYSTQQDILDFVEDNNVKFVRFAFCDIFGTQKNIAVLASNLSKAHLAAKALRVGSMWVNQYDGGDMTAPFGGYKQSGNGRD